MARIMSEASATEYVFISEISSKFFIENISAQEVLDVLISPNSDEMYREIACFVRHKISFNLVKYKKEHLLISTPNARYIITKHGVKPEVLECKVFNYMNSALRLINKF